MELYSVKNARFSIETIVRCFIHTYAVLCAYACIPDDEGLRCTRRPAEDICIMHGRLNIMQVDNNSQNIQKSMNIGEGGQTQPGGKRDSTVEGNGVLVQ